ncbi:MAG TPA: PAS domain-containing protein [Acidimicrobiales bacterium]|nr:PAS domain-containing protein [Acidimicrobiales bacterium]
MGPDATEGADELDPAAAELQALVEEMQRAERVLDEAAAEAARLNDEVRQRVAQVDALHDLLDQVLGWCDTVLLVVGPDLRVQAWSHGAEEAYGTPAAQAVGRSLSSLRGRDLPAAALAAAARRLLAGDEVDLTGAPPPVEVEGAEDFTAHPARGARSERVDAVVLVRSAGRRPPARSRRHQALSQPGEDARQPA